MVIRDKRAQPLANNDQQKIIYELLQQAQSVGRVVRGVNEATKYVNRGKAKLVAIAADAVPLEIVLHLPDLCEDKGIAFMFLDSREELGKLLGVSRPVISAAIKSSAKKTQLDDKIDHVLHLLE